jgi:enoyl-CoA hydratase/carnithine racemase
MNDTISLRRDGPVAELTISRTEARNAINYRMLQALEEQIDALYADTPHLLVLRGAEPGFCAGIDLKESREATSEFVRGRVTLMHRVLDRLRRLPCPVIGAINGVAVGLGCELAISADLRLATADARFSYPEPRLAVPSPTHHLVALIGLAKAQDMLLTARWIEAEEAVRIGLATRIVDDMDAEIGELKQTIMALAPLSMRRTKENLSIAINDGMAAASKHHIDGVTEAADTDDRKEALRAFAEKRAPRFTGQ